MEKAATWPAGVRAQRQLETRKRITEAAAAIFREAGYEAATMRMIAKRAGVATGTLFLHAPEKRSLLIMIQNDEMERATVEAFETLPEGSLVEQLVHIFGMRYKTIGRDPRLSLDSLRQASLLQPEHELDPDSPAGRYLAKLTNLHGRIAALVAEHRRRGRVVASADPDDVAAVAMAIYSIEVRFWLRSERPRTAAGLRVLGRRLALAMSGVMCAEEARKGKP